MKVLVMIPTFNERENIAALIPALFALEIAGLEVLVVDDQSPDGTSQEVLALAARYPALRLLRRSGLAGRGLAGREGFLEGLAAGVDFLIEMDGDLSHQPAHIPRLLEAMESCDMALGSRLVPGGSDNDRGAARQWLTRAANAYARRLLSLPVLDVNSGFRCFSRKALIAIDPQSLKAGGPAIVHETLFRAIRAGLRVREVPIEFVDRRLGDSKLDFSRLVAGYLWILKMRIFGR